MSRRVTRNPRRGRADSPTRTLPKPSWRLLTELLRKIFKELPDSRTKGLCCADLCSASLVCRAWEPATSAQIWTHVVIRSASALRALMDCSRASEPRADRAATVRILELEFLDNDEWLVGEFPFDNIGENHQDIGETLLPLQAEFVRFIPRFTGVRALFVSTGGDVKFFCPSVPVTGAFLSSCPSLDVLQIPGPTLTLSGEPGMARSEAKLGPRHWGDRPPVVGPEAMLAELAFYEGFNVSAVYLLMRSLEQPVVELVLTGLDDWWGQEVDMPSFEGGPLSKLVVVELDGWYYWHFNAIPMRIRPPCIASPSAPSTNPIDGVQS
ncbi:hypothetical protein BDK51DRAFT_48467 [Blyttiomyces helicus]|uniref:F-box domain-containing protein n=1 Tax=Blyttiomyces helicus TaxID=388810 RepID=A0A4P9W5F1_9FUNG|nr:hypothetical protein BDK51DRAFT_48467 [Blyttiomyces helicus]|eukprot:RKO87484.1 hypothetical protein BDK51DRAFT_48467 [Blyttiomyces helicus]